MKILIVGSCRNNDFECKDKYGQYLVRKAAIEVAKREHSIITGGAGGLQGIFADLYKQCNGPNWTAYYANEEWNEINAYPLSGRLPDESIMTRMSYPMRNAYYTNLCDGVLAFSGKVLTLGEIISASKGYGKRVFQIRIGNNIDVFGKLSELETVFISTNINCGLDFLEGKAKIK